MFAVAAIGFVCFLYSRYTLGMAKSPQWRMLRAGGSYMMGNALACLAIVVAMGCQAYRENLPQVEIIVAYGIRFLMLLLGLEFLINLVLDFYRPKLAGEDPTPAFDSRILALISDPTGIARNIAEAVNYQFGFEVTSTWFYQLLKRWLLPLTVFTILALFALSTVVVVDADQQAFIEHFGRAPAADATPLAPGLHFKWPWPFDALRRESVHEIHEIVIGTHKDEKDEHADAPILWTEKHEFVPETMLMLATPESVQDVASPLVGGAPATRPDATESSAASERGKAVGVSLLMVSIPIEYRIKKLHDYLYRYQNPEAVMEAIAFRTLTEFGAGQDIYGLMGPDRAKFNTRLRDQIQQEFDHWKLGVEITFLGLQDAHPPPDSDVAKTFQSVITAEQQKEATIRTASGLAESMLTEAAGSTQRAAILDEAIQRMNTLQADANADPPAVSAALQRVDELLLGSIVRGIAPVSGSAAKLINDARAQQIKLVSEKESDATVFANQLVAYKAAPDVYLMRQYLDMLGSALQRIRKYVVTTDRKASKLTIILEAEQGVGAPLPDVDKSQPHP
jgi:regulator of protease activity HflC (stomatin/prohibitin superfamily)